MLEVLPFKVEHLAEIAEQEGTAYLRPFVTEKLFRALESTGHAFSARWDGRMVGSAGLFEHWLGRAELWAFLDDKSGPAMLAIHKAAKRFLEVEPYRRVEAIVDCDFLKGHKWVRMLGFTLENPRAKAYFPTGGDVSMYALVRPWQ